jgi:glycosyltransferase involved in cell wall biosynthesis
MLTNTTTANPPWHILTGEYPPHPGGVADYTASIARGLVAAGQTVHVWMADPATTQNGPVVEDGVIVHRWPGGWIGRDLTRLGAALDATEAPRRLLVQYVPQHWGLRGGANLTFSPWLLGRRKRGDDVWTMCHEPYLPWGLCRKPTRAVLALIHRMMMYHLIKASSQVFTSTGGFAERLRVYDPRRTVPMTWTPVPSNIATRGEIDPAAVAEVRRRVNPDGRPLIGHFGTFGEVMRPSLHAVIPEVLAADPERHLLLIGRRGPEFAASLTARHSALTGRITATGGLAAEDAATHIAACDLMIQTYPDGVSTRRGTAMGDMGLGMPIVTNRGCDTEPTWSEFDAVRLVDSDREFPAAVNDLLADPSAREALGRRALALYEQRFAISHTIDRLLHTACSRR